MLWLVILPSLVFVLSTAVEECGTYWRACQPQQIHLSFGEKSNDMVVTWSTMLNTDESFVQYGVSQPDHNVTGSQTLFIDGGLLKHQQWIHRVTMKDLEFDTSYVYKVGSKYSMSKEYSFKTPPEGEDFVVSALFFGDMGIPEGSEHKVLQGILKEIKDTNYHMAVHNGDIAYDLDSNDGFVGDSFMNMIEPLAANIPYMVSNGNHECAYNFSHYKNRFTMPGGNQNLFYSFNLGLVHFIVINPEVYYSDIELPPPKDEIQTHYNWFVADLQKANLKENREKRPWIIVIGHRPFYCSSATAEDLCRYNNKDTMYPHRVGIEEFGGMGLEPLLKDYGVDLAIWAHEHYYERSWPMFNGTVYKGIKGAYINPGAPVHITSGAAGNNENNDLFYDDPFEWSAFGSSDYGYSRLHVFNRTHLYMDQMSTDPVTMRAERYSPINDFQLKPTKIDEFWLVREEHKPYDI